MTNRWFGFASSVFVAATIGGMIWVDAGMGSTGPRANVSY
jgi:hypothetical protein